MGAQGSTPCTAIPNGGTDIAVFLRDQFIH